MFPVVTADARAHLDAIAAALEAGLPDSYTVCEAVGPANPSGSVPYVVFYGSVGRPGGQPFCPGRDLLMSVSLRGVGTTVEQAQRAAQRGRTVLLSGAVTVAGRNVVVSQDDAEPPPAERDDSITPPLFSQLLIFDLRSDPT